MSIGASVKLNSEYSVPLLGLGTWQIKPEEVGAAVKTAVKCGYRHLDCAFIYGNEKEIGASLKELFEAGTVRREDLVVTTKLWNTFHRYDSVRTGFDKSLEDLSLDYIDLYLMHSPIAFKETDDFMPKDEHGNCLWEDIDYLDTWRGMEELVDAGLVRSIGISNFNIQQIQRVLDNCRIKPAMLQIEMHPYLPNKGLIDFCHANGIAVTAYSSFGNPGVPDFVSKEKLDLFNDPVVKKIAAKHGKGSNHVLLRFAVDQNICFIPKSCNPERIKDNFNIFDFKLDQEDLDALHNTGRSFRLGKFLSAAGAKHYPLE
jgi:aldehyde reductase